jgi:kynureninase
MKQLRAKSESLTGFLEFVLRDFNLQFPEHALNIITPEYAAMRGCQLSLIATSNGKEIFNKLTKAGVFTDWREPNVIRMAPVPLYNSFEEVWKTGAVLNELMHAK